MDHCDRIITSWDCSFKGKERTKRGELRAVSSRSYVVGQVWAFRGASCFLLDLVRDQWDIKQTIDAMLKLIKKWPQATAHLVEDKANGPAIQTLLADSVPGLIMVEPRGSKIQRAYAVAPMCEAGQVFFPTSRHSPWVDALLDELGGFPFAAHDDQVDALTQALIREQIDETNASMRALQRMVGNG